MSYYLPDNYFMERPDGLILACIVAAIHWLADFVLQSQWMSLNKSKSNKALLSHVAVYTAVWAVAGILLLDGWKGLLWFLLITFVTHASIDYVTSRYSSRYFAAGQSRKGFMVVGFDQLLHHAQLFLCFYFLQ